MTRPRVLAELLLLAAIWGASFLFMRIAAPAFGPWSLAGVRVLGAVAFLLPLLLWRREWPLLRKHWRPIFLVGLTNSALPFVCFSYAALAITGGLSAIFNATTPLWGHLLAWWWLKDKPGPSRLLGLAIGFGGVVALAGGSASFKPGAHGVSPAAAIACCLLATWLYGFSANFTRRYLAQVPSMVLATGSQMASALVLVLPMAWHWPAQPPAPGIWLAVLGLALVCTGLAYVLYFRLIAGAGAPQAMSVTYLIPLFAMVWGTAFLGEPVTPAMVGAGAVILLGTAMVLGAADAGPWSRSSRHRRGPGGHKP